MRLYYIFILFAFLFSISFVGQNTSTNTPEISKSEAAATKDVYKLKEVDYAPIFSKGKMSQKDFLRIYLKYPAEALEKGIEGTVILSFIVDTDGEVTSPSILQGDHSLLNQEAIRIASLIPYYTPGYFNDVPVATQVLFPITFELDESISGALSVATAAVAVQDSLPPVLPLTTETALQASVSPAGANESLEPIYIIDGKMIATNIDLDANKIESIRVIKGSKALQLYGQKAKGGVVIITTKLYPDTK